MLLWHTRLVCVRKMLFFWTFLANFQQANRPPPASIYPKINVPQRCRIRYVKGRPHINSKQFDALCIAWVLLRCVLPYSLNAATIIRLYLPGRILYGRDRQFHIGGLAEARTLRDVDAAYKYILAIHFVLHTHRISGPRNTIRTSH